MEFDFYLSEMAVSDLHGGGLTLQRIIGDDLMRIKYFVHVNRFADDLPASARFRHKCINLGSPADRNAVRAIVGRTLSAAIDRKLFLIKRHAKNAARVINSKFLKGEQVTALVCPQGAISLYAIEALKKYRPVKYITWVMDDHLLNYVDGQWQYPKAIEPVFAKHLREAAHVFVISQPMQQFYLERFGVQSTVLFGSSVLNTKVKTPLQKSDVPLKLGYFGAVTVWQIDAMLVVARVLTANNAILDIYSGIESLPEELRLMGVQLKGKLKPEQVLPTMHSYDAVLLPVSFTAKMRNMSVFNIATKMSEYLASGVPVLAVGPSYAAMIKYLGENDAAVLIETDGQNEIAKAFDVLADGVKIDQILNNARQLVAREVGAIPMRKRWLSAAGLQY